MTKAELSKRMSDYKSVTRDALQLIWNNTVKGQQKQLLKNPEIKELLDRYGVDYGGDS